AAAGAGVQGGLAQAMTTAVEAVAEALGTTQAVVRTFPSDVQGQQIGVGTPRPFTPDHDVPEIRQDLAAFDDLPVLVELGLHDAGSARLPTSAARMQQMMRALRVERALVCPLVSQDDLVGYLVLGFARKTRPLTMSEADAVLEVG